MQWFWSMLLFVCAGIIVGIVWAANLIDISPDEGRLIMSERHEGWGKERCQSCHVLSLVHKNAPGIRGIVRNKGYDTCAGCHGSNGTTAERRCIICHNAGDLPSTPILSGMHTHNFLRNQDDTGALDDAGNFLDDTDTLSDQQCLICHEASDMNGRWDINVDLTKLPDQWGWRSAYTHESEFCLRCHNRDHQLTDFPIQGDYLDPIIAIEDSWHYIDKHGFTSGSGQRTYAGLRPPYRYGVTLACTECHAMHGTENAKLILDDSRKGVFYSTFRHEGVPVRSFDGDYSQLCVLCHQMDILVEDGGLDTGNGLFGVHEVGSDCTPCHTHGRAAQAGL